MTRKKKEDLKPPRRHEVYAVEMRPRGRRKHDVAFQEFAQELEERMNYARAAGHTLMMVNIIEGRGALVVMDTQPPENPLEALRSRAIPLSAVMPQPVPDEDDMPRMHPELHNLLSGFSEYVVRSGIKRGTDKEADELKSYIGRALSATGGEEIRQMLDSLKAVAAYHETNCDDDKEDCDVLRFFKLAQETLSTYLNQRLQ
jgi:hypothetical protein